MGIDKIRPCPDNALIYRQISRKDPEIRELARSIREHGIREPLVITEDGFIISGHRRFYAATAIVGRKEVPIRIEPIRYDTDPKTVRKLLAECNTQRIKSVDEIVREKIAKTDPKDAYQKIVNDRKEKAADNASELLDRIDHSNIASRADISPAKELFLNAIKEVLENRRQFWPLSDRTIHYGLLNHPPLIHASKPASRYGNNIMSYRALCDLLARARINRAR